MAPQMLEEGCDGGNKHFMYICTHIYVYLYLSIYVCPPSVGKGLGASVDPVPAGMQWEGVLCPVAMALSCAHMFEPVGES